VTTHDPSARDDSTLAGGTVPLKEEEWIVIPNVRLFPEGDPLTSAMIGSLVRHFVDARNDDTTSTNIRNTDCKEAGHSHFPRLWTCSLRQARVRLVHAKGTYESLGRL
jgi:hypothetical protein